MVANVCCNNNIVTLKPFILWSIRLNNSLGQFIKVTCIATTSLLGPNVSGPRVTTIGRFHCIQDLLHEGWAKNQMQHEEYTRAAVTFEPRPKYNKSRITLEK